MSRPCAAIQTHHMDLIQALSTHACTLACCKWVRSLSCSPRIPLPPISVEVASKS